VLAFTVTAYDEIIYPTRPHADTHPDRLATIATLFGMAPAPVERCRFLEIACGDAGNLIPMAYELPRSEFVGFDLAARPIEMGERAAARLGLSNVTLSRLDLNDFPPSAGRFDYIVAHGLYSWVPGPVRDRLLALIGAHLAPHGVAFVSYNVYPGCYVRRMLWEMLKFHTDHLDNPQSRIAEARALTALIGSSRDQQGAQGAFLKADLEGLLQREAGHFFHDDLADINDPVYFHQFVDHASQHGLQFLGEAELKTMGYGGLEQETRQVLAELDPLTREQYLDFVRLRRFRQTLLCRSDVPLERTVSPEQIARLLLAEPPGMRVRVHKSEEIGPAASSAEAPAAETARSPEEKLLQAMLDALHDASPRRLELTELMARVGAGAEGETLKRLGSDAFRQLALGAAQAGALELHVHAPALVLEPGERPVASPIARLQIESDNIVTSLCHDSVKLDDAVSPRVLALLDGTRDRTALRAELADVLDGDDEQSRADALDACLANLARLALLIG
jgi:SAM-dependent methyltransferase